MTAILALEHSRGVVLGSDSRLSTGAEHWDEDAPKWCAVSGITLALAGEARTQLLAETIRRVRVPRRGERAQTYLAVTLVEALRRVSEECRIAAAEGVIVWRGRAYYLDQGWAVVRPVGGIVGAGSGGIAARAAAVALEGLEPVARVRRALEIAALVCPGVGGPLHVVDVR